MVQIHFLALNFSLLVWILVLPFHTVVNIFPFYLQELFYHNGSGFIEYRLKTVRQKLLPEQMRRRRSSTQASQGTATHSKAYIEEDDNSDQEPDSRQQEMVGFIFKIDV